MRALGKRVFRENVFKELLACVFQEVILGLEMGIEGTLPTFARSIISWTVSCSYLFSVSNASNADMIDVLVFCILLSIISSVSAQVAGIVRK